MSSRADNAAQMLASRTADLLAAGKLIKRLEAENERLRREIDSLRPHVEGIGYAG